MRRASSAKRAGALVVAMIAGRARHARRHHPRLGLALVAHRPHRRGRRPDEDEAGRGAAFGEVRAFGEEAVARMDGFGARSLRRGDQGVDRKIGLRRRRGADAHGGVGETHMQRLGVGVAIDRNDAKALVARGANDAAGDLAAIGDEHGGEARAHAPLAQDGARFSMKALSPSRPSGAAQGLGEAFRRRLDIGLGRLGSAGAEEPLGLGVGGGRAALDRRKQGLELRVALCVAVAIEVGEAERRGLAPVEPRAGQGETAREPLAEPGDEMGRDLGRRYAEARLGKREAGARVATTMSAAAASPMPPPTAGPSTAAIVTNGSAAKRAKKRPPAALSASSGSASPRLGRFRQSRRQ